MLIRRTSWTPSLSPPYSRFAQGGESALLR